MGRARNRLPQILLVPGCVKAGQGARQCEGPGKHRHRAPDANSRSFDHDLRQGGQKARYSQISPLRSPFNCGSFAQTRVGGDSRGQNKIPVKPKPNFKSHQLRLRHRGQNLQPRPSTRHAHRHHIKKPAQSSGLSAIQISFRLQPSLRALPCE